MRLLPVGLKGNQLQKVQRVQNAAARVICSTSRYEHISPSLYNLHWLPVSYRIQFKILLLVYKSLNGLAPLYLSDHRTHRTELLSHFRKETTVLGPVFLCLFQMQSL